MNIRVLGFDLRARPKTGSDRQGRPKTKVLCQHNCRDERGQSDAGGPAVPAVSEADRQTAVGVPAGRRRPGLWAFPSRRTCGEGKTARRRRGGLLWGTHARAGHARRLAARRRRRSPFGVGPRFPPEQALTGRPPRSAGSRQGSVVTPGGAPTPPGCATCVGRARRRRTGRGPGFLRSRPPGIGTASPAPPRPVPPPRRLMKASARRTGSDPAAWFDPRYE